MNPSSCISGKTARCGTHVELPWREGVNSNAYYFVDVVAERGPSPIRFTGDRESRLGDLAVVALAGETNRVPLLIGISYAVTDRLEAYAPNTDLADVLLGVAVPAG